MIDIWCNVTMLQCYIIGLDHLVLLTRGWGAYRLNPSCHGRRLILGIVRDSQGTSGFLKQNSRDPDNDKALPTGEIFG